MRKGIRRQRLEVLGWMTTSAVKAMPQTVVAMDLLLVSPRNSEFIVLEF